MKVLRKRSLFLLLAEMEFQLMPTSSTKQDKKICKMVKYEIANSGQSDWMKNLKRQGRFECGLFSRSLSQDVHLWWEQKVKPV